MKLSPNLRVLLIAVTIGANLLVFALTGYSAYQSRWQYEWLARAQADNIANALDQSFSNRIDKVDFALRAVVDDLERQLADRGVDAPAINRLISRFVTRLPEVDALRISDHQGQVVFGKGVHGTQPVNWSDRGYFIEHKRRADAGLIVTKPLIGRVSKEYIIAMARRYNGPDGRFAGVVAAAIPLAEFNRMLSHFELGPKGTATLRLVDDFSLITRYPPLPAGDPAGAVGQAVVSPEFSKWVSSGVPSATYHAVNAADGVERRVSLYRLKNAPMVASVGLASEDYLSGWYREIYQTVMMASGFLLLSVLAAWMLLRLLSQAAHREASLRESEETLTQAQRVAHLGSFKWDVASGAMQWSDELFRLWGLDPDGTRPTYALFLAAIHADDAQRVDAAIQQALQRGDEFTSEYRLIWPDGSEHMVLAKGQPEKTSAAGPPVRVVGSVQDVTESNLAKEKIQNLAYVDQLTRLPNRALLQDRLRQAIAASDRSDAYGALLLIDLDNFKTLNDTRGHDTGDMLLQQVAQRLGATVRAEDTVARLGGDEFVVVLVNLSPLEAMAATQAESIGTKILAALDQPYHLGDRVFSSTASIGVTLFKGLRASMDDLLRQADMAMYKVKESGRDALCFFDVAMQTAVVARAELESSLRQAIDAQQFILYFQPQVVGAGQVVGAEALVRWRHPVRGMVSPAEFIPLAESTGLIVPLGHWVLEAACGQLAQWALQPQLAGFTLSVNVSVHQFRLPDFVGEVLAVLKKTGAPPGRLKLELTESMLADNVQDIIDKMFALRAKGVGFSLDDFGTGYSSLSYLKRLPLDQLKIDQSFVRDILSDPNDAVIARTIISLAHTMGLGVIAEGVETQAQRAFLAQAGCQAYQGFLFSRPLPLDDFMAFVRASSPEP